MPKHTAAKRKKRGKKSAKAMARLKVGRRRR